jgi:hypothetical protein
MRIKLKYLILFFLPWFVPWIILKLLDLQKPSKKAIHYYSVLHNAMINGHIIYIQHEPAPVYYFKIEGDTNYYYGMFADINDQQPLQSKAKEGDSIFKRAGCDTFMLFTNSKMYYYEIGKPFNY